MRAAAPSQAVETYNSDRLLAVLNLAAMCLPWLWICGAPLSFALTTTGLLGAERLRRQSRPPEDSRITQICRELAASLRISCRVGVAICDRIAAPILLGVFRPMILLPAAALAGWAPQQLEMVLLHELAHVWRYDNLVNLVQRIIEALLFFQPMVWIVSGWVRQEREHCCDELVVARTRQPHAYAEMLLKLAEAFSKSMSRNPSLAHPQVVSSMAERPLVARIRRILKKEEQAMQVSRKTVGVVLAFVIVMTLIAGEYCLRSSRAEDAKADAATLVRGVIAEESKVHDVKSMFARFVAKWKLTPEGITKRRAEWEGRFPGTAPPPTDLRPEMVEELELAFDGKRMRRLNNSRRR